MNFVFDKICTPYLRYAADWNIQELVLSLMIAPTSTNSEILDNDLEEIQKITVNFKKKIRTD